jgi:hypothetical protein
LALGAVAFGVVLAAVIGVRLDQAALAVIAGVACGVAASIPTGLLVVFLLRRRDAADEKRAARGYGREMAPAAPVVVVAAPAAPQSPQPASWPGGFASPAPARRKFAVIGEEGTDDELDYW